MSFYLVGPCFFGSCPWLFKEIEERCLELVVDAHGIFRIYLDNPSVLMPRRSNGRGCNDQEFRW